MRLLSSSALLTATILSSVHAQFPPKPTDVTVIPSNVNPNVTISFKETSVCANATAYSGFVHLPSSILRDVGGYNQHTYFLYFPARQNAANAPLGVYFAGGPGESSTYSALSSESGPCYVNNEGTDTIDNPWSLNNHINMLYIDHPTQTGFSYSELVNATFDVLNLLITEIDETSPPPTNSSFGYGTFPKPSFNLTANTTVQAAKSLWYFAEHWLSSFPGYQTKSQDINIFGNSAGGLWVPEFAVQLTKGLEGLPDDHALVSKTLRVNAVGITNGWVDMQSQMLGYPEFAFNNTYDMLYASPAEYDSALTNYTMSGGCRDQIDQCRELGLESDPNFTSTSAAVNELCMEAFGFCSEIIQGFAVMNEHWAFDVAQNSPEPCNFYLPVSWYLNNATTQQNLGVPLNFTYDSNVVAQNFGVPSPYSDTRPLNASSGDLARQNGLTNIEFLLSNDVKVAFIYGDRDYRCPWIGGEATALAANWTGQSGLADAGYQEMEGISTPVEKGGLRALVKQYGRFSFSRVMDSGHSVSAYAPETVYRIWDRTVSGLDVVTGMTAINATYSTTGPKDSFGWRNKLPAEVPQSCYVEGQLTSTNPWDTIPARYSGY